MKIYDNIEGMEWKEIGLVTTGTFDGLHKGHIKVIKRVKMEADRLGGESMVITFRNHPMEVINKEKKWEFLLSIDQKLKILKKEGIGHVILLRFDEGFRMKSREKFIDEIRKKFGFVKIILGKGWRFGKYRMGCIEYLKGIRERSFDIEEIGAEKIGGRVVSSSEIRRLLNMGEVELGNEMLGRKYSMTGKCEHGQKKGRNLGYSTINFREMEKVYPKEGVYQTITRHADKDYASMSFVWGRDKRGLIESHLFNFKKEIYKESVEVFFDRRIRESRSFKKEEELKDQLEKDKRSCLEERKVN